MTVFNLTAYSNKIIHVCFVLVVFSVLSSGCGSEKQDTGTAEMQDPAFSESAVSPEGSGKDVVSIGDTVKVQYKGSLSDGTVFDQSHEGDPLSFVVGEGLVISGFEQGVLGMKLNEEKTITIKPEDAYGAHNEEMIRDMPKAKFPSDLEPEVGKSINLHTQDGQQLAAIITKVGDEMVTIDFNHPLAGKELTFFVKVVGIR